MSDQDKGPRLQLTMRELILVSLVIGVSLGWWREMRLRQHETDLRIKYEPFYNNRKSITHSKRMLKEANDRRNEQLMKQLRLKKLQPQSKPEPDAGLETRPESGAPVPAPESVLAPEPK